MEGRRLGLVMAGGVAGAFVRWGVAELLGDGLAAGGFPWATFIVNLIGTALLAAVSTRLPDGEVRSALSLGFCGGLTTMSTFAVELVELVRGDELGMAIIYGIASLLGGLALFVGVRRSLATGEAS